MHAYIHTYMHKMAVDPRGSATFDGCPHRRVLGSASATADDLILVIIIIEICVILLVITIPITITNNYSSTNGNTCRCNTIREATPYPRTTML